MITYTQLLELKKSVDETKLIINSLLEVMLNDSIGSAEQQRQDILEAGKHTVSNILDSKILNFKLDDNIKPN